MKRCWLALPLALFAACGARTNLNDDSDQADVTTRDGGSKSQGPCKDEVIASDPNGAISLAVDVDDTVFWGNEDGQVQTRDANGSRILATEPTFPIESIGFDASNVYYTIANELRAVSRAGGTPTTISSDVGDAFGLIVDGTSFYLLDRGSGVVDGRVLRVDADGTLHELMTDLDIPTGIASDADSLYVAAVSQSSSGTDIDGPLFRIPKNGGAPTLLASFIYGPSSVSLDETSVFVAAETQEQPNGEQSSLFTIPKSGGTLASLGVFGPALSLDTIIDNGSAYMTTYYASGAPANTTTATLLQIPIDGSTPTTLSTMSNGDLYGYVRTSPTAIYWTIDWPRTSGSKSDPSVRKKCK